MDQEIIPYEGDQEIVEYRQEHLQAIEPLKEQLKRLQSSGVTLKERSRGRAEVSAQIVDTQIKITQTHAKAHLAHEEKRVEFFMTTAITTMNFILDACQIEQGARFRELMKRLSNVYDTFHKDVLANPAYSENARKTMLAVNEEAFVAQMKKIKVHLLDAVSLAK